MPAGREIAGQARNDRAASCKEPRRRHPEIAEGKAQDLCFFPTGRKDQVLTGIQYAVAKVQSNLISALRFFDIISPSKTEALSSPIAG
jgi:hypothetical protein